MELNNETIRSRVLHVLGDYDSYYKLLTKDDLSEEKLIGVKNSGAAFKFIMGHLMLRGRNDNLSATYADNFLKILRTDEYQTIEQPIADLEKLKTAWTLIQNEEPLTFQKLSEKFGVGPIWPDYKVNRRDLKMIIDLLRYQIKLFESDKSNMFDYLVDLILQKNLIQAYSDLLEISNVGDKLSSFTLRDIIFLISKSKSIEFHNSDYPLLFPVDTWVSKGGKQLLGLPEDPVNPFVLKVRLISLCKTLPEMEIDPLIPLKLNAGIWYHFSQSDGEKF